MRQAIRRTEQLYALTGLRILLAAWVLLMHLHELSPWFAIQIDRSPEFIRSLDAAGSSAVGMFFLLSGFVLAYSYDLSATWDAPQRNRFWLARLARLYPMYLVGELLAFGWTLKIHLQHHLPFSIARAPHVLRVDSEVLLLVQSWIPTDAMAVNAPGWSLSVEAFFYATLPFLGVLLWKLRKPWQLGTALLGCWLSMCGVALALLPAYRAQGSLVESPILNFSKFDPLVRLPEFIAGIVLCRLFLLLRESKVQRRKQIGAVLSLGGLVAGLVIVANFPAHIPPLLMHNGILMPATCALMLGLALGGGPLAWFLSRPLLVFLGEASFSLYLIHVTLYRYVAGIAKIFHVGPEAAVIPIVFLPVALISASLFHVWVERPARIWILERWGHTSKRKAALETPATADPM